MAIADWIRERTARNREKFRAEVMQEGFELGRAEGHTKREGTTPKASHRAVPKATTSAMTTAGRATPRNLRRTACPTPTRQPEHGR